MYFSLGYNFNKDPPLWTYSIQNLKALRIFKVLYFTKLLNPLNELIYSFFITTKKISYYFLIILIYCLSISLIA